MMRASKGQEDLAGMSADELAALEHALQSDVCRDSFADFVAEAWHLVPPARPYVANLASSALIAHLQAVADGEIRRLLVATPPGTGKSTIASVMYPAWRWTRRPGWRAITASHAHRLALRDSVRTRRLVEGEWYRSRFAKDTWELRGDQNRGDDYENTKGGRRLAVGVGGALTGDRADEADCDDLLNAMDARSDAARRTVNDWVTWALMNRLDDPEHAPIVVIQQRLHGDDPIGHLLETGGWEYLRLPAEFDSRRRTVTCIWSDPRQEDGELLAPELHSRASLAEQKRVLGSAGYSCQFGQDPVDESGGMFQRQWWRFWKPDGVAAEGVPRPMGCWTGPAVPLPGLDRKIVTVDCAFKKLDTSDFVAAHVWGRRGANVFLLDRIKRRLSFTETEGMLRDLRARWPDVGEWRIESAANGEAIIDRLRTEIPGVIGVSATESKEARAAAISPIVEAGQAHLPDGAPWLEDFISEHAAFPRGKHDDDVDATSMAIRFLVIPPMDKETEEKRRAFVRLAMFSRNPGVPIREHLARACAGTPYVFREEDLLPGKI